MGNRRVAFQDRCLQPLGHHASNNLRFFVLHHPHGHPGFQEQSSAGMPRVVEAHHRESRRFGASRLGLGHPRRVHLGGGPLPLLRDRICVERLAALVGEHEIVPRVALALVIASCYHAVFG